MATSSPSKHVCSQCNNVYNSLTYLEIHIKTKHEIKSDLKGNICEFTTPSGKILKTHKRSDHNEEQNMKCNFCAYVTKRKDSLKQHNLSNHFCTKCEFKTGSRKGLMKHQQSSQCDLCEYEVGKQEYLKKHIQSRHEGKQIDCNDFDFSDSNLTGIVSHRNKMHKKQPPKPNDIQSPPKIKHICPQCNNEYNSVTYLNMHIQTMHENRGKYQCNQSLCT